jgi:hypothetical protein
MKQALKRQMSSEHKKIIAGSKKGWAAFNAARLQEADNDLVLANWSVKYDPLGHDILVQANVKVAASTDVLLQVWLEDHAPGIWIPEVQPWIASVVEFAPEEKIKSAHVGLIDSKWRPEDRNVEYVFVLSGYVQHKNKVESFRFEKKFVYPG